MILDLQTLLSDKQAITTGTQLSTNSFDLWNNNAVLPVVPLTNFTTQAGGGLIFDPGRGAYAELWAQVTTAFTVGTSLQLKLVMADDVALGTNLLVLQEGIAILEAALVPGYRFRIGSTLPVGFTQRFLGIQYVSVGTHTTGNVSAGIVMDSQDTFVG